MDDKILALIDLKIEDDMKQVIAQLQSLENKIDTLEKRHSVVLWVVGIAFAVIAITLAIVAIR